MFEHIQHTRNHRINDVIPFLAKEYLLNFLDRDDIQLDDLANFTAVAWNLFENEERDRAIEFILSLGHRHLKMSSNSDKKEIETIILSNTVC